MGKLAKLFLAGLLLVSAASATTLSLSDLNYDSNSDFYGDDHLAAQFTLDGTGESLEYTIPSSQISSSSDGTTDKSLTVSGEVLDVAAEYQVEDRNLRRIENLEYIREEFSTESEAKDFADSFCTDVTGNGESDYIYYNRWRLTHTDHYIGCAEAELTDPVYNVGFLQSPPDRTFEAEFTVEADGKSAESAIITNDGTESGSVQRIGPNTQIEFVSLRDFGSSPDNPQNTLAAYSSRTGWKLINQNDYQNYANYVEEEALNNIEQIGDVRDLQNWEAQEETDELYSDASTEYTSSGIYGATGSGNNLENGVMEYRPDSDFEWFVSEFLIRVDGANYLEIQKELGDPQIQSVVSGAEITDIASDNAEITVKNVGEGAGLFEGQVQSCSNGITSSGTSDLKSVDPGETVTFYPTVSGSSDEDFTGSCEFIVEDRETGAMDSTSFDIDFTQSQECTPGHEFIRVETGDEVIYECAENGVDWEELETCGEGLKARRENGDYSCVEIEDPDITDPQGDCTFELFSLPGKTYTATDPICVLQNWWDDFSFGVGFAFTLIDLVFAAAAGLIGFGIGNKYVSRILALSEYTNRKTLKFGVSAVLGIVAALIAYNLFAQWWVKLIILIALIILGYLAVTMLSISSVIGLIGAKEAAEG